MAKNIQVSATSLVLINLLLTYIKLGASVKKASKLQLN